MTAPTRTNISQPIRPQQFYADIDGRLDGLNREDYTKELLSIGNNDCSKLIDYIDLLNELRPTPTASRRVNRRHSATGTKEDKCATYCYVL